MFAGVNENDARAAMKVYSRTIGDQNGVYVSTEPELLDGTNAVLRALALKRNLVFALTAPEFLAIESLGLEGPLLCSSVRGTVTEEYLLLTRDDSSLRRIEGLVGSHIIISSDLRSSLALCWLEVLLAEHHLASATQVAGRIAFFPKTTQVVLPVFFGKADACIVTRNNFEVMCELNPQLKKQLRILATSPTLVPALSCFSRGTPEALKQQILKAVDMSASKPAYQQIMTLFKADGVGNQPLSVLENTRELMATYLKLRAVAAPTTTSTQTATPRS